MTHLYEDAIKKEMDQIFTYLIGKYNLKNVWKMLIFINLTMVSFSTAQITVLMDLPRNRCGCHEIW